MSSPLVSIMSLNNLQLWKELEGRRFPLNFEIEITARCNNSCRHCYINLPADDAEARAKELSSEEISRIADEAVSMGTLSCLISGGEPLLRPDFAEIYLSLKRKGLLVSVFTNATLITTEHIRLFREYPPRNVEVTVYGVTKKTYEGITRSPGSFSAFIKGLTSLLENGIHVRLKAMALRSNVHELPRISEFCRKRTKDYFRFDPMLNLRYDRDAKRNAEIRAERLTPEEITAIERADTERFDALTNNCNLFIFPDSPDQSCGHIFRCGLGKYYFNIGYDGMLRPCPSLWHPDCMYDLRKGSLKEAWDDFIPRQALDRRSTRSEYLAMCHKCPVINLCLWCPAIAYLETGELDLPVDSFCKVAHARASAINKKISPGA